MVLRRCHIGSMAALYRLVLALYWWQVGVLLVFTSRDCHIGVIGVIGVAFV